MKGEKKARAHRSDKIHKPEKAGELYGFMRRSVIIPPGFDLTEPVFSDESFLAEDGEFYSRD